MRQVIKIKENMTSLPMLVLASRHDTEVKNVYSQGGARRGSVYISSRVTFGHESNFHGPLFSTWARLAPSWGRSRRRRWSAKNLIYVSLLMVFQTPRVLKDRFAGACEVFKEMFPAGRGPGGTYQGYLKARRKITGQQLGAVKRHLRRYHHRIAGRFWRRSGWLAFSVDGTRVEVPRTKDNETSLGCAGRRKTGPQLSLTVLYHLGTCLPWAWRIGGGTESEVGHLRRLLKHLPKGSLLVADSGFTGFDLLKSLGDRRVHFLVRMGSNRTLLTGLTGVRVEIQGEIVWFWPEKKRSSDAPLMLRLIRIEKPNRSPVYLVTSVLEGAKLSDKQVGEFYRMRWGQEVFYRSFKRTLEQHTMRSGSPVEARRELDWAMMGYLTLGLLSVEEMIREGRDPRVWSPAGSLRVIRRGMTHRGRFRRRGDLRVLLGVAKDGYVRTGSKKARDWPHKKNDPPPGAPKIREADEEEKDYAKRIYDKMAAA
jgi:hypothetical protein